jgi:subtilisin family serine protease
MPAKTRLLVGILVAALAVAAPPATAVPSPGSGDGAWYRVRFGDRITSADRAALERAGAESLLYVHRNAYLAWLADDDIERARTLPGIRSMQLVPPAQKLDASLIEHAVQIVAALIHADGAAEARRSLEERGQITDIVGLGWDEPLYEATLRINSGALTAIAARPEVAYVGPAATGPYLEDEGTAQILAGNLHVPTNRPVPGYEAWLDAVGIDGSGVMVTIVDSGVDASHPDLEGRVEKEEYSVLPSGEPVDSYGHGTHVAGIVGGDAAAFRGQGGAVDLSGFLYGLGVAPGVSFLDQNAISTTSPATVQDDWPPEKGFGFARITREALMHGAAIWNASWHTGEGTGAGYLASARMIDTLVRDGDLLSAGAEPFTMVFSAGNAGPGPMTLTSPHEAKNIIAVASTRSQRFGKAEPGLPIETSEGREDIDLVSSFSSRGPARDGRFLPTVAAPGELVVSTRSNAGAAACNEPPHDGNSFGLYALCSGTSMAAPHVTGSVALLTQWWRGSNRSADPSPAMAKALLVNSATDMGIRDIPNGNEGWGRVNLGELFDPKIERVYVDQTRRLSEIDQRWEFEIEVADPGKPLKVTLAWSDVPGTPRNDPTKPVLVNDLDLLVRDPAGSAFPGNLFVRGRSVKGAKKDHLNNVENVFLPHPSRGTYRIWVSAHNLPGDGVLFRGDATDQDFALVVSNAVEISVSRARKR